jgi:hypothetical protein
MRHDARELRKASGCLLDEKPLLYRIYGCASGPPARFSSDEPIVAGGPRAVAGRKIPPGCTRSQDPENAIEHAPIIDTRHAARLVGKQSANDAPLTLRKLVTHDHTSEGVEYLQRVRRRDGHVHNGVDVYPALCRNLVRGAHWRSGPRAVVGGRDQFGVAGICVEPPSV